MDAALKNQNKTPFHSTDFSSLHYKKQLRMGIRFFLNNDTVFYIRNIVKDDVKKISLIEQKIFRDPWTEQIFRSYLDDNFYFWALAGIFNQEIAAYLFCRVILDEVHLDNLAVENSNRRCGVGNIMVWILLKIASVQEIRYVHLEVRKSNIAAISLYEKYGFKKVGICSQYYADNDEDALLMTKELSKNRSLYI